MRVHTGEGTGAAVEAEIVALATSGATTLVGLMATDAWTHARSRFAALLGRGRTDRDALVGDLDEARAELVRAREAGDDAAAGEAAAEWRGRLRRVLRDDPAAVAELLEILAEFSPQAAEPVRAGVHNSISGTVGTAVMGRDLSNVTIGAPAPRPPRGR
ncbi:hypothetical protein ACFRKE_18070 [Kitasatospora indigofera]|uniref:hypothetical protein n=1 Tax=Kitasatospora indigofera TaxID=67307 RepID=UPI00367A1A31